MRRKKHPEHVNHERWLVSYADFITLLFAFFVVMFASSQVDSKRLGRFTESFSKAVGIDIFPESGSNIMSGSDSNVSTKKDGQGKDLLPSELEEVKSALVKQAEADDDLKNVQVVQHRRELVLRLSDNVFFASGDDSVKESAQRVLRAIAAQLKDRNVQVRVEGHTDDRPIRTARFRSNWDLSTARATSVLMQLSKEGLPDERLAAAGYGEFRPVAPNGTDEGRKQNRRVDLVVSLAEPREDTP